jgi:hypothetical protein
MQSSLIGKIEKAKRYAQEPDRVTLTVSYKDKKWHCTCHFFSQRGTYSHTTALKRLFAGVLPTEAGTSLATDLTA